MPGKTVIMATEKSKEAFLDALMNNRFYATEARYVRFDAVSNIGVDSELRAYSDSKVRIANLLLFSPADLITE